LGSAPWHVTAEILEMEVRGEAARASEGSRQALTRTVAQQQATSAAAWSRSHSRLGPHL